MRRRIGCVAVVVFVGIFFAAGLGLSWWGWAVLQNARVSESWPMTDGEITYSQIQISTDDDGTSYHADVRFVYVVEDRRYEADTVSFGQYGSSDRSHAAGIVARYPVGQRAAVYYDPAKPETAVLEPGVTLGSYLILGLGMIFLIASLIMIPIGFVSRSHI